MLGGSPLERPVEQREPREQVRRVDEGDGGVARAPLEPEQRADHGDRRPAHGDRGHGAAGHDPAELAEGGADACPPDQDEGEERQSDGRERVCGQATRRGRRLLCGYGVHGPSLPAPPPARVGGIPVSQGKVPAPQADIPVITDLRSPPMKAAVRPEHHLLAVEHEHDVNCMFELTVPAVGAQAERPPLHIALVIDRSGSMAGDKLDHARRCAAWLGERLRPTDELALVTFDDEARLVLPRTPVDATRLAAALVSVRPGGTTNLSGGWLKGLEQLRSSPAAATRRILLLTDGMANVGINDGGTPAALPRRAQADGVGTTTIGFGADFDEDLLTAMADSGGGNAHWAETPDMAPEIFSREFDGLTRLCAQNVSVEIRPSAQVRVLGVLNEYPQVAVPGGVQVELGDAYGGETRNVVFGLHIPH